MFTEFRKFILRGNVVELAVAVVIGGAFNTVVQSLVKDFITPLIQGVTGQVTKVQGTLNFSIANRHFMLFWGDFVSSALSFVVIAAVVFFLVVQPINKLTSITNKNKTTAEPTTRKCPECLSEIPKAASRCAFCQIKLKTEE